MRWILLLVVSGLLIFLAVRWAMVPSIDVATFVETPETWEWENKQWPVSSKVDVKAPESVIRWPAFKSAHAAAPALELRIRRQQWGERYQAGSAGLLGPGAVGLRLDWPESDEERAKAPENEEQLLVIYQRVPRSATRDLLYDERYRANSEVKHASPMTAPREEAVVIWCGGYGATNCNMIFEYLGRPVELNLPRRRFDDWQAGRNAALRLLASIATPMPRK